jgi:hypothetical protein
MLMPSSRPSDPALDAGEREPGSIDAGLNSPDGTVIIGSSSSSFALGRNDAVMAVG